MVNRLALLAAATAVSAQTFSSCNPTKKSGCPDDEAYGTGTYVADFTKGAANDIFTELPGTAIEYDDKLGAVFKIANYSDAPTMESNKYIFYGRVDVVMRFAPGQGVVSSIVLQSDDLDEVDYEFLGGYSNLALTNYFSQGCTEKYDRGTNETVNDGESAFHTYSFEWTSDKLEWLIDNVSVRTLVASQVSGCDAFPQTPMKIKLGSWDAGGPDIAKGTQDWAGGQTDISKGPFNAYYQKVTIQDYMGDGGATSAGAYHYSDMSGSSDSIKIVGGNGGSGHSVSSSKTGTATQTGSSSTTLSTATQTSSSSSSGTTPPAGGAGDKGNSGTPSATTTGANSVQTGAASRSGVFGVGASLLALLAFL